MCVKVKTVMLKTIGSSFHQSLTIIGFKLDKIFSKKINIVLTLGLLVFFTLALLMPSNLINLAPALMGSDSNVYQEFISTSFILVAVNGGVDAVNLWLSGILATVFVAPLISNTLTSSYSKTLMTGVRRGVYYQISDSIILQFLSPLVIIALVYTFFFSSLIQYEYGVSKILTLTMTFLWLVSVPVFTFLGWVNELMSRKYGFKAKTLYVALVALVAYLVYNTETGEGFFGLSETAASWFIARGGEPATMLTVAAATIVLIFTTAWLTFIVGIQVIHKYPPPYKEKKYPSKTKDLYVTSLKTLFRYDNIRAPLIFMAPILSVIFVIQSETDAATIYALSFILPLVFNLTIFVNIFGILNSGTAWLASLPKFRQQFFNKTLNFSVFLTLTAATLVTLPSLILQLMSAEVWVKFMLLTLLATLLTSFAALSNSFKNPAKYDLHLRGENIVPPGHALKLTGIMLLVGGVPVVILSNIPSFFAILIFNGLAYGALLLRVAMFNKKFTSGYNVNRVITLTSS